MRSEPGNPNFSNHWENLGWASPKVSGYLTRLEYARLIEQLALLRSGTGLGSSLGGHRIGSQSEQALGPWIFVFLDSKACCHPNTPMHTYIHIVLEQSFERKIVDGESDL